MKAKFVYESIKDILKPKSEEEILGEVGEIVPFKLSDQSITGTHMLGYLETSYKNIVEVFGPPNFEGDNYKVSTEWIVEDENGNIATIYDWKSTNLFSIGLENVEEFRNALTYNWHIGAKDKETALNLIMFFNMKIWYSNES